MTFLLRGYINGVSTPTTDTSLFLVTCDGRSHLASDIKNGLCPFPGIQQSVLIIYAGNRSESVFTRTPDDCRGSLKNLQADFSSFTSQHDLFVWVNSCNTALNSSLSYCLCYCVLYAGIKCCRQNVICIQLFIAYDTCNCISSCNFHL